MPIVFSLAARRKDTNRRRKKRTLTKDWKTKFLLNTFVVYIHYSLTKFCETFFCFVFDIS